MYQLILIGNIILVTTTQLCFWINRPISGGNYEFSWIIPVCALSTLPMHMEHNSDGQENSGWIAFTVTVLWWQIAVAVLNNLSYVLRSVQESGKTLSKRKFQWEGVDISNRDYSSLGSFTFGYILGSQWTPKWTWTSNWSVKHPVKADRNLWPLDNTNMLLPHQIQCQNMNCLCEVHFFL